MGGYGSGRRSGRDTTSDFRRLDVRQWQKRGYLGSRNWFSWQWTRNGEKVASIVVRTETERVVLSYKHRSAGEEDWQSVEYPVAIEWTPCNYGGLRAWFRCPTRGCGRRVAILYGGTIFACRNCHQLAYDSQREPPHYRALYRAQAIRMKLGGSGSMADLFPPKPKGMHWRTYQRLRMKEAEADARAVPPWLLKRLA